MSERGQKIFKLIVWIIIAALVAVGIFRLANYVKDIGLAVNEPHNPFVAAVSREDMVEDWTQEPSGNTEIL